MLQPLHTGAYQAQVCNYLLPDIGVLEVVINAYNAQK